MSTRRSDSPAGPRKRDSSAPPRKSDSLAPGWKVPLVDLRAQYAPLRVRIRAAIDRVCDAQDFILGAEVESFETELARFVGAEFAIGVSSGTDALLCALLALELAPGD